MAILTTGVSALQRRLRFDLVQRLKRYFKERKSSFKGNAMRRETVFNDLRDEHVTREMFDEAIRMLEEENYLVATHQTLRLIGLAETNYD